MVLSILACFLLSSCIELSLDVLCVDYLFLIIVHINDLIHKDVEPLWSSPLSESSSCTSFSSPVSGILDGAEEYVDAYEPEVSDGEASTSAGRRSMMIAAQL